MPFNLVFKSLVKFFSVKPPSPTVYVVFAAVKIPLLSIDKLFPTFIPPKTVFDATGKV